MLVKVGFNENSHSLPMIFWIKWQTTVEKLIDQKFLLNYISQRNSWTCVARDTHRFTENGIVLNSKNV